jgi:SAM-dependent methyltransferase
MSGYQLSGNAPDAYVRYASHVMAPWTDDLIAQARCANGDHVLDVACGTGFVSNQLDPNCKVAGVDVNEGMLAVARQNTNIDWHSGSAIELPFADGSFDVVLCQQGLQYFPDRSLAVNEMARVLRPGGRVSLNVWGPIERQPFHAALLGKRPVCHGVGLACGLLATPLRRRHADPGAGARPPGSTATTRARV